jgi:hypothetical protein
MQLACAYKDTTRPKPTHEPGRSLFPRCRSTRVLLLLGRPAPQLSLLANREYALVRQKHLIRRTKIAPRIGRRKVDRTTKLAQPLSAATILHENTTEASERARALVTLWPAWKWLWDRIPTRSSCIGSNKINKVRSAGTKIRSVRNQVALIVDAT